MVKSYGSGMYTDLLVCRIDQASLVGLTDIVKEEQLFLVYPNPTNSQLHVMMSAEDANSVELSLFDIRGRLLYLNTTEANTTKSTTIDIRDNVPGLYLLEIKQGNTTAVKKIIKN